MRPSTPAVLRPALISVTRRTLTRALLRDRSISFCRLRAFFRSPACDAAKSAIFSRRTFSSAWPQSAESQPGSSSGPSPARCPTCPSVPASSRLSSAGSPGPRQRSSSRALPYPASYAGTAGGGASIRFPVSAAFRPPAFASRAFLRPLGDSASLTVGLPAGTRRTPSGFSRSACGRCGRGGRPLNPGDGGALPAGQVRPAGACRLPGHGRPLFSRLLRSTGGSDHVEASPRIHLRSPVRPSPACGSRMERGHSGLSRAPTRDMSGLKADGRKAISPRPGPRSSCH